MVQMQSIFDQLIIRCATTV